MVHAPANPQHDLVLSQAWSIFNLSVILCRDHNTGTDAEASAESLLRDSAKKHALERAVEAFEVNSATGNGADEGGRETDKTLGGGLRQTLAAATEPPNIDMAMAGVLGGATLPPPGSVEAATAAPVIAADASNNTLAGRKASTESMGSADSFSVTRDASWLGFEPAFGDIYPGKSAAIKVRNTDSVVVRRAWHARGCAKKFAPT